MRVAVVAGPDAGHAIPAIELARRLVRAGDEVVVHTGARWAQTFADCRGPDDGDVRFAVLPGLDVPVGQDADAGARLGVRAATMTTALTPRIRQDRTEVVVGDVITVCGGWAAEQLGLPWLELSPHPLYEPSRGLPPIGSGLQPGGGVRGGLRDRVMRAATARSRAQGERQRAAARESIGLTPRAPGPSARLIATLPALEVERPDWPDATHLVGPLLWEPTRAVFTRPPGRAPLVLIAPSTATTGVPRLVETALTALDPTLTGRDVRVVISALDVPAMSLPPWAVAGTGRQDEVLGDAAAVICGGGHGMLAKSLSAGVPVVAVPGGGDQWELACRAARHGSAACVRPLTVDTLRSACDAVLDDPAHAVAARRASASAGGVFDPVTVCHTVVRRERQRRARQ